MKSAAGDEEEESSDDLEKFLLDLSAIKDNNSSSSSSKCDEQLAAYLLGDGSFGWRVLKALYEDATYRQVNASVGQHLVDILLSIGLELLSSATSTHLEHEGGQSGASSGRYECFAALFAEQVTRGGSSSNNSLDDDDESEEKEEEQQQMVCFYELKLYGVGAGSLLEYLLVCLKLSLRYIDLANDDEIHTRLNKLAARLFSFNSSPRPLGRHQRLVQLAYALWLDSYLCACLARLRRHHQHQDQDEIMTRLHERFFSVQLKHCVLALHEKKDNHNDNEDELLPMLHAQLFHTVINYAHGVAELCLRRTASQHNNMLLLVRLLSSTSDELLFDGFARFVLNNSKTGATNEYKLAFWHRLTRICHSLSSLKRQQQLQLHHHPCTYSTHRDEWATTRDPTWCPYAHVTRRLFDLLAAASVSGQRRAAAASHIECHRLVALIDSLGICTCLGATRASHLLTTNTNTNELRRFDARLSTPLVDHLLALLIAEAREAHEKQQQQQQREREQAAARKSSSASSSSSSSTTTTTPTTVSKSASGSRRSIFFQLMIGEELVATTTSSSSSSSPQAQPQPSIDLTTSTNSNNSKYSMNCGWHIYWSTGQKTAVK